MKSINRIGLRALVCGGSVACVFLSELRWVFPVYFLTGFPGLLIVLIAFLIGLAIALLVNHTDMIAIRSQNEPWSYRYSLFMVVVCVLVGFVFVVCLLPPY
jgi:hypothetical protein